MKEAHDLSVTEFAEIVNLRSETIRELIRHGKIKGFYKIGRQWRITLKTANRIRKLIEQ